MKQKGNIKNAVDVEKLNWLIINILVKIKQAKMDFIQSVKNVETPKPKSYNSHLEFFINKKEGKIWLKYFIVKNVIRQ